MPPPIPPNIARTILSKLAGSPVLFTQYKHISKKLEGATSQVDIAERIIKLRLKKEAKEEIMKTLLDVTSTLPEQPADTTRPPSQ